MVLRNIFDVSQFGQYENMSLEKTKLTPQTAPCQSHHTCFDIFLTFSRFRQSEDYSGLIDFLIINFPKNVKNKTFNFINTGHLFHSLYAYIPPLTDVTRERKQIRLSEECIKKLFVSTINDFKLYNELYTMLRANRDMIKMCPCELLMKRRNDIIDYVDTIKNKQFDTKPLKLKKEPIDNIMYKYSLNWKNMLLKKKIQGISIKAKKKRKIKVRKILNDDVLKLEDDKSATTTLIGIAGFTLRACDHTFTLLEKQLRSGDEAVSFIKICTKCSYNTVKS